MTNTGKKIYSKLAKVTNDINQYPLDANDELCSVTGLPQATKLNTFGESDYIAPFEDLTFCPLGNIPVDCVVSEWSNWSECIGSSQTRTRIIVTSPTNGGSSCPILTESRSCVPPIPCREWSASTDFEPKQVTYVDCFGETQTIMVGVYGYDLVKFFASSIISSGGADVF